MTFSKPFSYLRRASTFMGLLFGSIFCLNLFYAACRGSEFWSCDKNPGVGGYLMASLSQDTLKTGTKKGKNQKGIGI